MTIANSRAELSDDQFRKLSIGVCLATVIWIEGSSGFRHRRSRFMGVLVAVAGEHDALAVAPILSYRGAAVNERHSEIVFLVTFHRSLSR